MPKFLRRYKLLTLSLLVAIIGTTTSIYLIRSQRNITSKVEGESCNPEQESCRACAIKTCQGPHLRQCLPKTVYVPQGQPCPEYNQCERNNCATPPTPTPGGQPTPTPITQPTIPPPSSCPRDYKPCPGVYICRALCGCSLYPARCVPKWYTCPQNECRGPDDDAACASCTCTPWEYSGGPGEGGCSENARPMTRTCNPENCSATKRCESIHTPFPTRRVIPTTTPSICPLPKKVKDLIITCPECK